ncbi:MAG: homocysteine S-methyltransferase family protein, partial [bacterium]
MLKRSGVLILDGPMGTELQKRGVALPAPLWSAVALDSHPDLIVSIHQNYIRAGADIITTNTFRTAARTLQKVGRKADAARLTRLAVQLAKKAREQAGKGRDVFIAGSMAPLEDCYSPHLSPFEEFAYDDHLDQGTHLADAGVDLILIETMNTILEARAALK